MLPRQQILAGRRDEKIFTKGEILAVSKAPQNLPGSLEPAFLDKDGV